MNTRIFDPNRKEDIRTAGEILKKGGLVAIPTETVYGLAANALDPEAVKKIYEVKGRPSDNPLIVHISDFSEMKPLVKEIPASARKLAAAFWPGPLTIILPKTDVIPMRTSGGLDTVAIRFPSNETAQRIIAASGCPIAAPSANISGRPSTTDFRHVYEDLNGKVEGIVDGGECSVGVESTVITLATEFPCVLRPGGISVEQLREVLGRVDVDDAVVHKLAEGKAAASPGMKYKHYSPNSDIHIADMSFEDYVNLLKSEPESGALCFEGEEKFFPNPSVTFGKLYDGASQANRLFAALYELDEKGIGKTLARAPKKTGVGLAVYNRLIRSAGFNIIHKDFNLIGLTGTTGAGKTTVSNIIRSLGFKVIDCDKITRDGRIYNADCISELQAAFGEDILSADGSLDRHKVAFRAFSSSENTLKLNEITLPRIMAEVKRLAEKYRSEGEKLVVLDAPTLFEAGADSICARIICVTAPETIRLQRIMDRDSISFSDARKRIGAQKNDKYYVNRSDYIIINSGDTEPYDEVRDIMFGAEKELK